MTATGIASSNQTAVGKATGKSIIIILMLTGLLESDPGVGLRGFTFLGNSSPCYCRQGI